MGSGGRNASLAAMRLGQGGQQKRQHSSRMDRPFIFWHKSEEQRQRISKNIKTYEKQNYLKLVHTFFD